MLRLAIVLMPLLAVTASVAVAQDEPSEASMAAYADAANFQTNGATNLAIEGWQSFLEDYPDHPMAAKAAHYLGVCFMQKEAPDYAAASQAFAKALEDKQYDLREESLANHGWCLYSSAGVGEDRDAKRLESCLEVFKTLRKEFPKSRFTDRAIFYCGESEYGLGNAKKAIEYYDEMLTMPSAKDSPLRCDALYARGVAQEEADQFDSALSSYKQLLDSCGDNDLATDVHLRLGDLMIMRKQYKQAIESFADAFDSTEVDEDRAYALFRQAFAMVQAENPAEAAKKYEQLLAEYPDSPYAASATLASAQSTYRSGDIDGASERFAKVLKQNNPEAATEATHWLARIAIGRGKPQEAITLAREQIQRGVDGDFAVDVQLDLAEALSMDPKTMDQSLAIFEKAYRDAPDSPLAPRALYNAAFSALQTRQPQKALEFASEFITKFPSDGLLPDVKFVAAEGALLTGDAAGAAKTYLELIETTGTTNAQRPIWVLRAATTSNASGKPEQTIGMLEDEMDSLATDSQKAEAHVLIAQAHLMASRPAEAAKEFTAAVKADPSGPRTDEAKLMVGQSLMAAGKSEEAVAIWNRMIADQPKSRMSDQARYKLAQAAAAGKRFDAAIDFYDAILQSDQDPGLVPYALYAKAFASQQLGDHEVALSSIDQLIAGYPKHPLQNDALLSRGISRRNLGRFDEARQDLDQYLSRSPRGTNLGHALYELALVDQKEKQPAKAAKKLEQLVAEVPNYPAMDKVLYELGWSMQESGNDAAAIEHFNSLITKYPDTSLVAEASYYVGQNLYLANDWGAAAKQFSIAAAKSKDDSLSEKAHYRMGWSYFKDGDFDNASDSFATQAKRHPDGPLSFDALMMVGECQFKKGEYVEALAQYQKVRERIEKNNDTSTSVRDAAERQVRELTLLHGGQSAAQNKQWDVAIDWYDEMRNRFPSSDYLPQVFYETGFAYQQKGDEERALKFFAEVANNYRNELAARARFMMGEIYFAKRQFDKAIPEFQRVMFGFGADKAPDEIRNWQAKSGFEAGRCSELLAQSARTAAGKEKASQFAVNFFNYVLEKHSDHELSPKSRERLEALQK